VELFRNCYENVIIIQRESETREIQNLQIGIELKLCITKKTMSIILSWPRGKLGQIFRAEESLKCSETGECQVLTVHYEVSSGLISCNLKNARKPLGICYTNPSLENILALPMIQLRNFAAFNFVRHLQPR
jgi:hypothetical protein